MANEQWLFNNDWWQMNDENENKHDERQLERIKHEKWRKWKRTCMLHDEWNGMEWNGVNFCLAHGPLLPSAPWSPLTWHRFARRWWNDWRPSASAFLWFQGSTWESPRYACPGGWQGGSGRLIVWQLGTNHNTNSQKVKMEFLKCTASGNFFLFSFQNKTYRKEVKMTLLYTLHDGPGHGQLVSGTQITPEKSHPGSGMSSGTIRFSPSWTNKFGTDFSTGFGDQEIHNILCSRSANSAASKSSAPKRWGALDWVVPGIGKKNV